MAYSKAKISIPNVTGNIVITATGTPSAPSYTNLIPTSIGTDGNPFGTNGLEFGKRFTSSGALTTDSSANTTGLISVTTGDVIRFKNCGLINGTITTGRRLTAFNTSKAYTSYAQPFGSSKPLSLIGSNYTFDSNGELEQITVNFTGYLAVTGNSTSGASSCGTTIYLDTNSIVTKNEPIQ